MKKFKKLILMAMTIVMAMSIMACNKNEGENAKTEMEKLIFTYFDSDKDGNRIDNNIELDIKDYDDLEKAYEKLDENKSTEELKTAYDFRIKLNDKYIDFTNVEKTKDEITYKLSEGKDEDLKFIGNNTLKKDSQEYKTLEKYLDLAKEKDEKLKEIIEK